MTEINRGNCANCKFSIVANPADMSTLYCRRFPPQRGFTIHDIGNKDSREVTTITVPDSDFPTTGHQYWCGEYVKKEMPPAEGNV